MLKLYYTHISTIENQQIFDCLLKMLNPQRRSKVLRCKNEDDKKRSLLAGVLLKYALEKEGISYESSQFAQTPEGKPYMISSPDVHFSISHSGDYVACLIADKVSGMDIESEQRRLLSSLTNNRLDAVARRSFSKQEYELWQHYAQDLRKELFLNIWTRKESYSKAMGKGLLMEFSNIDTGVCKENDEVHRKYFSKWLAEGCYISIFVEDGIDEEILFEYIEPVIEV